MPKAFGRSLRRLRHSKKMSQRELAQRVGVDFPYISKVENDRLPPPAADTIVKICQVFDISPVELLASTGKIPSQVKEMLGASTAALHFVQQAHAMRLTEDEWEKLTKRLKRLRV
jgi:HTH-type transcriptional regulator, competence development regulator